MFRRCMFLVVLTIIPMAGWYERPVAADERQPADLLPASTVFYAEMNRPDRLVDLMREHPLFQRVLELDDVKKAWTSPEYLQFRAVVALIEAETGKPWPALLAAGTGGGAAVAFDARTRSAAVVVKATDESTVQRVVDAVIKLARQDAQNKGKPDPIKSGEYRGVTAYQLDDARMAIHGPWLVIVKDGELGKTVIDSMLDSPATTLAADPQFVRARAGAAQTDGWAYVNVAAIRSSGAAEKMFQGRTDNPVAELLIGGILTTLQDTPYVTATLQGSRDTVQVQIATPFDASWVPAARQYFFGPDARGTAPPLLSVPGSLFSLSAYRDLSEMWLRAGDLFDERTQDELTKADSNLTTLFAGKDFGTDILGSAKPDVQLVVTRQTFDADRKPAIELPSFALAMRLKEPDKMQPELRRTFQSLVGFLNVAGAAEGQPQLDLGMEKVGDAEIVSASYLVREGDNVRRLPINFNFSPTIAFAGDRFVLASTTQLAKQLIAVESKAPGVAPAAERANTAARIDFGVLREVIADNRGQLIAKNMLDKGHTKDEAEKEIATLLALMDFVRTGSATLTTADDQLRLTLSVRIATDESNVQ